MEGVTGERGLCAAECTICGSPMFGAGKGWAIGGRNSHSSSTHSYHSFRRCDDAPLPLLLGILATESPKEEEGGVKEMRDDGKGRELWRQMLQSAAE